jgi:hypothetical protein
MNTLQATLNTLILLLSMHFLMTIGFAQAPDTVWTRTFGGEENDEGRAIQPTNDGGFIVCGSTYSFGAGNSDVYLIKTNSIGDTLWTRTYGGNLYDEGNALQPTSDGGFIVCGTSLSFDSGHADVYLIKTDGEGITVWTKTLLGEHNIKANAIRQTSDGGFIITGCYQYVTNGGSDTNVVCLIKTDADGNQVWSKPLGEGEGNDVLQLSDGKYIVTGYINGTAGLIKTNEYGMRLWYREFHEPDSYAIGYSLQKTYDGGYIIAGFTYNFNSLISDAYFIKTNSMGIKQWSKTYSYGVARSILQTSDGGYISTGGIDGHVFLLKMDSVGNTRWIKTYGEVVVYNLVQMNNGGLIIAGYTTNTAGNHDVYLMKTAPLTNIIEQYQPSNVVSYSLEQNYPNPFNPKTTLSFVIGHSSLVTVKIYNLYGQEVAMLVNKQIEAGEHNVEWNAEKFPSGMYFYRLNISQDGILRYTETRKMILLK